MDNKQRGKKHGKLIESTDERRGRGWSVLKNHETNSLYKGVEA